MCDDLGSFIHQKRVEKKITMQKLAGMLDVPVSYLCDVENSRIFELAGNASVDTDLSGYERPACFLIEDPENGEKEWLQMVAELESRKN